MEKKNEGYEKNNGVCHGCVRSVLCEAEIEGENRGSSLG